MRKVNPLLLCCLSITQLSAQVNLITPVTAFAGMNASIHTGVVTLAIKACTSETGPIAGGGVGFVNYTSVAIRPSGNGATNSNDLF